MAPLLFAFLVGMAALQTTLGSDPDILTDFIVPANNNGSARTFTYTGMRALVNDPIPDTFNVTKASVKEFPGLDGQSVSLAILQFPAFSVNPVHTHPCASELLFLIVGSLDVGFVDTTKKLFTQTLQAGDLFVFPKGIVHYQYKGNNNTAVVFPKGLVHYQYKGNNNTAVAVSAFGGASAGTLSVPTSIFATGINDGLLAKSFKTDEATIHS